MTDIPNALVLGLRALATLARRGPLDVARLARINGWRTGDAAAVMEILEQEGLVQRTEDENALAVTPRAVALIGEDLPSRSLH